jgi:hypothetical protein
VYNIGIGENISEQIQITAAGPLSSAREEMIENYKNLEWSKHVVNNADAEKQTAHFTTLDNFLEKISAPKGFELLVVDVEGFECSVFKNFPFNKYLIKMIIVEMHDVNPQYKMLHQSLRALHIKFLEASYVPIYKDFTNSIYVLKNIYNS